MSFKKLLERIDKIAREELGNYYIISEAQLNNYLHCLESRRGNYCNLRRISQYYKTNSKPRKP